MRTVSRKPQASLHFYSVGVAIVAVGLVLLLMMLQESPNARKNIRPKIKTTGQESPATNQSTQQFKPPVQNNQTTVAKDPEPRVPKLPVTSVTPDQNKITPTEWDKRVATQPTLTTPIREQNRDRALAIWSTDEPVADDTLSSAYVKKRIAELDSNCKLLPAAALVMPLCDKQGKITELGILLSVLGMFHATFVPHKRMNLAFPEMENWFQYCDCFVPDKPLRQIKPYLQGHFDAAAIATGSMEQQQDQWIVALKFEGQRGDKVYEKKFKNNDLSRIPVWIARTIWHYLKIQLTKEEEAYVQKVRYASKAIIEAAKLYPTYTNYLWLKPSQPWEQLCQQNPDVVFFDYCRFQCLATSKYPQGAAVESLVLQYPQHDLIRYLKPRHLFISDCYEDALPLFFDLLIQDPSNRDLYVHLHDILNRLGFWEEHELLLQGWQKREPNSHLAASFLGVFYTEYAWHARGGGFANTVPEERWNLFADRLHKAQPMLKKAYEMSPNDNMAASSMISVCMGLNLPRSEMEQWFERAIAPNPDDLQPYKAKLQYLQPRWHGTVQEMLEFVQECVKDAPPGSLRPLILVDAMEDLGGPCYSLGRQYFLRPEVWAGIQAVMESRLAQYPDHLDVRRRYVAHALFAHQDEAAIKQILYLQDQGLAGYPEKGMGDELQIQLEHVEVFFRLADLYIRRNEPQKAMRLLAKGLQLDPARFSYHNLYGEMLMKEKRFGEAAPHFQSVSQQSTSSEEKSVAMQRLNEIKAIPDLDKVNEEQEKPVAMSDQVLYVVFWGEPQQHLFLALQDGLSQTFGIQVQTLPAKFTLSTRALRKQPSKSPSKRLWDGYKVCAQLSAQYAKVLADPKTLGVVLVISEEIGSTLWSFRLSFNWDKVGIVSSYRFGLFIDPPALVARRVLAEVHVIVGSFLGVGVCNDTNCVRKEVLGGTGHDQASMALCLECRRQLWNALSKISRTKAVGEQK